MTSNLPLGLAALAIATSPVFASEIGDPENGAKVFEQCASCHEVGPDAHNKVGPNLNGIYGRRAAIFEDFEYSKAMDRAGRDGLTWTLETLDVYVHNPKSLVTGTNMEFGGIKDDKDRADLLAYMRTFSDSPADIPEAEPTAEADPWDVPEDVLALVGDPEYGEYLSSECITCHRADGEDEGIPSITNWYPEDFVVAMHHYKNKLRPHPVMQMMASRLSNEEIAALAAYFETLTNE